MAYHQHHLRQVAEEAFQFIEEQFGRPSRLVDRQQPAPKPVYQKPGFSSTPVTYFNEAPRVPPPKETGHPRSNPLQATQGHGGRNTYQVPPTTRAKEPVIKTSGGWYVCKVPQVPTGTGDVITSEQAAKYYVYGGYLTRDFERQR